jgi:hypothetical protein
LNEDLAEKFIKGLKEMYEFKEINLNYEDSFFDPEAELEKTGDET